MNELAQKAEDDKSQGRERSSAAKWTEPADTTPVDDHPNPFSIQSSLQVQREEQSETKND